VLFVISDLSNDWGFIRKRPHRMTFAIVRRSGTGALWKAVVVAVGFLVCQGCGSDMGAPPDPNFKNNPPAPEKAPTVQKPGAGTLKVKSIKDRS
jgi:hypothetical protein